MRSSFLFLLVMSMFVSASACGKDKTPVVVQTGTKRVDPATTGTVAGRVTFEGQAPAPASFRMSADPRCTANGGVVIDESLLVAPDGGVRNAFVYVKTGLEDYAFDVPTEQVVLDNNGCQYQPHVFGVRVGQPLLIRNSDPTLHNVNAIANTNHEFNQSLPIQGMTITETFTAPEIGIPFKCNVHGWMTSYGHVVAHPYFAVTDASGLFSLPNLPPGAYTIEAWHEKLGTRTQQITIAPKQAANASFSFAG